MTIDPIKITSIKSNLFYRSKDIVHDYENFPWHRYNNTIDSDKIQSSQALAIDVWGCLYSSQFKNQLINNFFNILAENWAITLEYSDASLLKEPQSTQIDVLLKSNTHAIIVESKFTEPGGRCSQFKTKQCNGNYEIQVNPVNKCLSKCSLSGKNIQYWEYIEKTTTFHKNGTYIPCPFRGIEYQWMRNICFAEAFSENNNYIKTEAYLMYYDSPKCHIANLIENDQYLGSLKNNLKNQFQAKSYNDFINACVLYLDSVDQNEKQVWIDLKNWLIGKENKI